MYTLGGPSFSEQGSKKCAPPPPPCSERVDKVATYIIANKQTLTGYTPFASYCSVAKTDIG